MNSKSKEVKTKKKGTQKRSGRQSGYPRWATDGRKCGRNSMNYSRLFFVQPIPYVETRATGEREEAQRVTASGRLVRLIRDNDDARWKFRSAVRPAGRMQLRKLWTRAPARACDGAWSSEKLRIRSRPWSCKLANVNTVHTLRSVHVHMRTEGRFIWDIIRRPALIVVVNQRNPSPRTECD